MTRWDLARPAAGPTSPHDPREVAISALGRAKKADLAEIMDAPATVCRVAGERMNALLTGHQAKITQLGVVDSGDRPLLVSAAADNTIRVWDLAVHAYS